MVRFEIGAVPRLMKIEEKNGIHWSGRLHPTPRKLLLVLTVFGSVLLTGTLICSMTCCRYSSTMSFFARNSFHTSFICVFSWVLYVVGWLEKGSCKGTRKSGLEGIHAPRKRKTPVAYGDAPGESCRCFVR